MNSNNEWRGYSVYEDGLAQELICGLTETEVRQLHARLQQLGAAGWLDFLSTYGSTCARYLGESAQGRSSFAHDGEALLHVYGAIWLAQIAAQFGHRFDDPDLQQPGHLRESRAARGRLLLDAQRFDVEEWPFDEPSDLQNPFV